MNKVRKYCGYGKAGKGALKVTDRENQKDRLKYLVEYLKEDSGEYRNLKVPDHYGEARNILRSLMNIRMPKAVSEEILLVQDAFLSEEAREKGIVELKDIPTVKQQYGSNHIFADKLSIWQGDITRLKAGAIVNAANSQMLGCFVPCHKCIDNAIHSAAGMQLRNECDRIMNQRRIRYGKSYQEPVGTATITKGYNLPAEYVIHTVGPIVRYELTESLCQDLRNCYRTVLECALEHGVRSVAFCCISTGEFHFPNQIAARIAVETVTEFLQKHSEEFDRIIFDVFNALDKELYENSI